MKSETFEITKKQDEKQGVVRYTVVGRVNSKTSPMLHKELEGALSRGEINIALDMNQVEYLSSDGIRIILKIYKEAGKAGGKFVIEQPSEIVKNVLGMVALDGMLHNGQNFSAQL